MISGSIQDESITIINIYSCNREATQYVRQILTAIKGEINSSTTTTGDFNTHFHQWTDYPKKKNNNKETQALNDTFRPEGLNWYL